MQEESFFKRQVIPIALTVLIGAALIAFLWFEIVVLNKFTSSDIVLEIRWYDVLIGLTIYLKTAIDFAIYIGHLMSKNNGWKSRVSIELGTAVGNAAGTFIVLAIWAFFKEVKWLLAAMVFIASLVLFKLAEESLHHAHEEGKEPAGLFAKVVRALQIWLNMFNKMIAPALKYVIPNVSMKGGGSLSFWPLFALSFTVPFILGLDDFAGYVPLFNVINVFGFGIGVILGHMALNMFLYISPERTIKAVKNPVISFIGSLAFIGLGIWGLVEVIKIIGH